MFISEYVENWRKSMESANEIVRDKEKVEERWSKKQYDKKIHGVILCKCDRVLVRNLLQRNTGPGKFGSETNGEDRPVYEVKPETSGIGRCSVLHCNLLLPCQDIEPEGNATEPSKT
jgi:hypothetical protein